MKEDPDGSGPVSWGGMPEDFLKEEEECQQVHGTELIMGSPQPRSRPEQKVPSQPGSFPKSRDCTSSCRAVSHIRLRAPLGSELCLHHQSANSPQTREYLRAIRPAGPGGQVLNLPSQRICLPPHSSSKERPSLLSSDDPRPSPPCRAALRKNRGFQEGKDSHGLSNCNLQVTLGKSLPLSGAQFPST